MKFQLVLLFVGFVMASTLRADGFDSTEGEERHFASKLNVSTDVVPCHLDETVSVDIVAHYLGEKEAIRGAYGIYPQRFDDLYAGIGMGVDAVIAEDGNGLEVSISQDNIHEAVALWLTDEESATVTYGHISDWDVSSVTDFASLFSTELHNIVEGYDQPIDEITTFNEDLSSWDVSNVTSFYRTFYGASSFDQDISSWQTGNATSMILMFKNASEFNSDLSSWDVSSVTNMAEMFGNAAQFNGDISSWDVSSVNDMYNMFLNAYDFSGDLSSWDVSNVLHMSNMFSHAYSFDSDLSSWDVSSVKEMWQMFRGTSFSGDVSSWDVSSVTTMGHMFRDNVAFDQPLDMWNVSNVTNMIGMLHGTSMSNANYDATLIAWAGQSVQPNVDFDASAQYCSNAAVDARQVLVEQGWMISDFGQNPDCITGCTDETACNYAADAAIDDGSCTFISYWFEDTDGDGLGDGTGVEWSCEAPSGYVAALADPCASDFAVSFGFEGTEGCGDEASATACFPVSYQGHYYDVVQIGNQCWFAENLRSTATSDGTMLDTISAASPNLINTPAWSMYDYSDSTAAIHGLLYNGIAVEAGGLCPSGWHVGSDEDWLVLEHALGIEEPELLFASITPGESGWTGQDRGAVSDILKDDVHWSGSNETGFSATPGGWRYYYNYIGIDGTGQWWSPGFRAHQVRNLRSSSDHISRFQVNNLAYLHSVRCVLDERIQKEGCTDANACNYDAAAEVDDGSCAEVDDCGVCGGTNLEASGQIVAFDVSLNENGYGGNYLGIADADYQTHIELMVPGAEMSISSGGQTLSYDILNVEPVVLVEGYRYVYFEMNGSTFQDDFSQPVTVGSSWTMVEMYCGCGHEVCIAGCMDALACNFNEEANQNNSNCAYPDENGECGSPVCDYFQSITFDGYEYPLVAIGDQCWFQENLQNTHFANGDEILTQVYPIPNSNLRVSVRGVFENNEANASVYGRRYNWNAVVDHRGLCPAGWHPATLNEWNEMLDLYGGGSAAAPAIWAENYNSAATNESGFTLLPAGMNLEGDVVNGPTSHWTATSNSGPKACRMSAGHQAGCNNYRRDHRSVRCIKGAFPEEIGCADPEACNYNPAADADADWLEAEYGAAIHEQLCHYPDNCGSCDFDDANTANQACSCGEVVDACGVCGGDGLTCVPGCIQASACNYNPEATVDDGSCAEEDACGECAGSGLGLSIEILSNQNSMSWMQNYLAVDTAWVQMHLSELNRAGSRNALATLATPTGAALLLEFDFVNCDGNCTNTGYLSDKQLMYFKMPGEAPESLLLSAYFEGGLPGGSTLNILDVYCDCDGSIPDVWRNCDGSCDMDTDGDGVCDQEEIPGCTDTDSCSYDPNATDDDGSCQYLNACGVCGGPEQGGSCDCPLDHPETSPVYGRYAFGPFIQVCAPADGSGEYVSFVDLNDDNLWQDYVMLYAADEEGNPSCGVNPWIQGPQSIYALAPIFLAPGECLVFRGYDYYGQYPITSPDPALEISALTTPAVWGCTDDAACNYDADATDEDGSCLEADACGICGGSGLDITLEVAENAAYNGNWPQHLLGILAADIAPHQEAFESAVQHGLQLSVTHNGQNGLFTIYDIDFDGTSTHPDFAIFYLDPDGEWVISEVLGGAAAPGDVVALENAYCDCDGNMAAEHYDCDGVCTNDADGDGVCDELEVPGCTDETACNYDADATDEDGSCLESDACGACGGSGLDLTFVAETYGADEGKWTRWLLGMDQELALAHQAEFELAIANDLPLVIARNGVVGTFGIFNVMYDGNGNSPDLAILQLTELGSDEFTNHWIIWNTFGGGIHPGTPFTIEGVYCDCDGALPVSYANCDGSCANDADGDGVCDETEVAGCTDATSCSYDSNATDDDGSCVADVDGPVILTQTIEIELDENGEAFIGSAAVLAEAVTDDCGEVLYTSVLQTDFNCSHLGAPVTVTVISEDSSSNMSYVTVEVTVVDPNGYCTAGTMGCTYESATNFDADAVNDDGSCEFDFDTGGGTDACADLDQDGLVASSDLLLLLAGYGTACE